MSRKNRKSKVKSIIFIVFATSVAFILSLVIIWICHTSIEEEVFTSVDGNNQNSDKIEENWNIDDDEINDIVISKDTEDVDNDIENYVVLTQEELLEEQARNFLNNMTIEQKIYQMIIVTPEELTGVSTVVAAGDTTRTCLKKYPVGGIVYFSGNLVSPEQTKEMLTNIQEYSNDIEGLPLFLCVDEEGGRVTRLAQNPSFGITNVGSMESINSRGEAFSCGNQIGKYLNELGFNVDFAPDVDVLTNSENRVIGDRSFGSNADIVTEYGIAYSDGLHNNHVMSTFKHFPGHGATEADTHQGYAYTDKTYEELYETEIRPFAVAQENEVDFVMVAHISLPNVIGDDIPCSLSKKMVSEILRDNLGFNGIVITDALNMGAISEQYSPSESAVLAVEAGVDMLLIPSNLKATYDSLYEAYNSGRITEERIDESVYRIVLAKLKYVGSFD